ncbi:hypothetical protein [Micromonospora sp. URMC 103]|uniref:hypothetical protein n=1 Tax=Micromonospora sp. URMC 103 TaxID=3423406 RepID=UPI003F1BEE30
MRLTVGPLPPAVYWRRRAVVLGAGLLFLIVLLYSCTGSGNDGDNRPQAGSSPTSTGSPSPTASILTPTTGSPPPEASGGASTDAGGDAGATASPPASPTERAPLAPAAGVADDGSCTDAEIKVTPVAQPASVQSGAAVDLQLKIKNTSDRTCSRDVGADHQEIFVKSGAEKVWSSDTCGTAKGSDVQSFTPNFERMYEVTWNGQDASRCANGVANGPAVAPGTYQVFARVGTKISDPAKLTVTG